MGEQTTTAAAPHSCMVQTADRGYAFAQNFRSDREAPGGGTKGGRQSGNEVVACTSRTLRLSGSAAWPLHPRTAVTGAPEEVFFHGDHVDEGIAVARKGRVKVERQQRPVCGAAPWAESVSGQRASVSRASAPAPSKGEGLETSRRPGPQEHAARFCSRASPRTRADILQQGIAQNAC